MQEHKIPHSNTKEGMHETAKLKKVKAWSLGCSCDECAKEFAMILSGLDGVTFSNDDIPTPTFHCSVCWEATEGYSICLKCNPQRYEIVGMKQCPHCQTIYDSELCPNSNCKTYEPLLKALDKLDVTIDSLSGTAINAKYQAAQSNVYAKEVWNEAIEAAAILLRDTNRNGTDDVALVRKLKK